MTDYLEDPVYRQGLTLDDLQELHGTLCHVVFVFQDGSSHLPVFSNLMTHYKGNTFIRRKLSGTATKTLRWWIRRLRDTTAFRQLHPIGPLRDHRIYVDASTSWGIGIVIGRNWYSLKLAQGWKEPGRDICWLEAIAIEILFQFLVQLRYHDIHLLIHSDNKAAIGALSKSRSPNVHLNLCARRTQVLGSDHMIVKKLIYVESRLNPADRPSRGLTSSSLHLHNRLKRNFSLPPDLAELFVPGDW
jgi:hypothetical protein